MPPPWSVLVIVGTWAQEHGAFVMSAAGIVVLALGGVRLAAWWAARQGGIRR